jgi:hypothetical protein
MKIRKVLLVLSISASVVVLMFSVTAHAKNPGTSDTLSSNAAVNAEFPESQDKTLASNKLIEEGKAGNTVESAKELASDSKISTFSFPASLAENNPAKLLSMVDQVVLPEKKIPVIVIAPGQTLNITDPELNRRVAAKEIYVEPVDPESAAGKQLNSAFLKHGFVALEDNVEEMRAAVSANEGLN